jgi:hypothetical protein
LRIDSNLWIKPCFLTKGNTMKNKLLISTALVTSLVAAQTASYADAKVTGSVEYTYNSVEDTTSDSSGSIGSESTVQFSGTKDSDIGTITTSFKLEEAAIEAPVIKITNGNTTVGLGADFAPNLSATNIPSIGDRAGTVGKNIGSAAIETVEAGGTIKNGIGLMFAQKFDGGQLSIYATPDVETTQSGSSDSGIDADAGTGAGSAYNIVFKGNMGVDGLSLFAGINDKAKKNDRQDGSAKNLGVSYNFGSLSVGVSTANVETSDTTASQDDLDTDHIAVAYAVNDNFSVAVTYAETDGKIDNTDMTNEEETTMVSLGYNLGGLGLEVSYVEIDNLAGNSDSDGDAFQIRTVGKF